MTLLFLRLFTDLDCPRYDIGPARMSAKEPVAERRDVGAFKWFFHEAGSQAIPCSLSAADFWIGQHPPLWDTACFSRLFGLGILIHRLHRFIITSSSPGHKNLLVPRCFQWVKSRWEGGYDIVTALRYVLGLGMKGKIALGMGCSRGTGFDTKKPYNSGKTSAVRDWASKAVPSILSALVSGTLFSLPQMLLSVFIYLPTESSEEPFIWVRFVETDPGS